MIKSGFGFVVLSNQPKGVRFLRKLPAESHHSPSHPSGRAARSHRVVRPRFYAASISASSTMIFLLPLLLVFLDLLALFLLVALLHLLYVPVAATGARVTRL